jgi:hypothetical protein
VQQDPAVYTLLGADAAPTRAGPRARSAGTLRPSGTGHWTKGYADIRVFFVDEETAIAAGYRPCGNCMRARYRE